MIKLASKTRYITRKSLFTRNFCSETNFEDNQLEYDYQNILRNPAENVVFQIHGQSFRVGYATNLLVSGCLFYSGYHLTAYGSLSLMYGIYQMKLST